MRLGLLAAAVVAVSLLVGACSDDDATGPDAAPTQPPAPTPPDDGDEGTWPTCENPELAYRVEHPEGWAVNDGPNLPACSLFAPEPFEVPAASEIPLGIAVAVTGEQVPVDEIVADGPAATELSSSETTVDGHRAVRRELRATGEGLYPEGVEHTVWVVDADDHTLVARTTDAVDDLSYDEAQRVLDRMVASLEISSSRPGSSPTSLGPAA